MTTTESSFFYTHGSCTKKKKYKCHLCFQSYNQPGSLKQHLRVHAGAKPFTCKVCGESFSYLSNLNCHKLTHKPEQLENSGKNSLTHLNPPPKFKCTFCDRCFPEAFLLVSHQRVHTGERLFKCNICMKAFAHKSSCMRHEKRHKATSPSKKHPDIEILTNNEGTSNDHELPNEKSTRQRNSSQTEQDSEKPFVCIICYRSFSLASSLRRHVKSHDSQTIRKPPKFECEYCTKRFRANGDLKKHIRTHTGEKPFVCVKCELAFRVSAALKKHEMCCNGKQVEEIKIIKEKVANQCATCGKTFSLLSSLRRHEKGHEGNTSSAKFQCDICEKRFWDSGDRNKHRRGHTGEQPYACSHCNKTFSLSSNLKRHEKTHDKITESLASGEEGSVPPEIDIKIETTVDFPENEGAEETQSYDVEDKPHGNDETQQCNFQGDPQTEDESESHSDVEMSGRNHSLEEKTGKTDPIEMEAIQGDCPDDGNPINDSFERFVGELKTETVNIEADGSNGHNPFVYVCANCRLEFHELSDLRSHSCIKDPKGKKTAFRHYCEVCKKGFKRLDSLRTHRRVHTGEKPYNCKVCRLSFSQSSSLRRHVKNKHDGNLSDDNLENCSVAVPSSETSRSSVEDRTVQTDTLSTISVGIQTG